MIITQQQAMNELKQLVTQLDDNTTFASVLSMVVTIIEDDSLNFLDATFRGKFADFYID